MLNGRSWLTALVLALAAAGCSGSDGAQGPAGSQGLPGQNGQNGQDGQDGQDGVDGVDGKDATAPLVVDNNDVAVSNVAASVSGANVVITYNVKVRGENRDDFVRKASAVREHVEDAWWVYNVASTAGVRTKIPASGTTSAGADWTVASNGSGDYTATITGLPPEARVAGATYMLSAMGSAYMTATVVATFGAPTHDAVGDQACINCHGNHVWRGAAHDVTNPIGAGACVVCHNRVGSADPRLPGFGSGLMGIVHGIHNSHNMPDREYVFTWTNGNQFKFSVGFPGYMNNCSTCHDTTARLAAVKDAPFSYGLCFSCHDTLAFGAAPASHATFTTSQACGCHAGQTVSDMHNGLKTERSGLIWDGQDQSVVWGNRVKVEIASIGYDPGATTTLVVRWTTKWDPDGDGVFIDDDPCNTVIANGPVFMGASSNAATGQAGSNYSIIRAYAQGDDWVASLSTTSPGQPYANTMGTQAPTLTMTGSSRNTTCAANVATTKVKADNLTVLPAVGTPGGFAVSKGQVALQGKPQIRFDPAIGTSVEVIQVRAKSPARQFRVSNGSLPPEPDRRRQLVSIDKCNTCHLGSMYQHGGTRVDSIELCIMCHNSASNEKQNRVGMDVTAAEAYDGKLGQTYDLRTMVHAIHSAGESGIPLVYYRSNGIYFFGSRAALQAVPTWPGGFDPLNPSTTAIVFGSNDVTRTHNFIEVHYPRPLYECGACHVNDSHKRLPDPAKVVAVTDEDAGAQSADVANVGWRDQLDDVLRGPVEASCMTCHQSTGWAGPWLLFHAASNGFAPAALPGGRQDFIGGNAGEMCATCHGEGRAGDLANAHR